MKRVEVLYICGFSGAALDANSLLKNFRQLKYLKIAHSNFSHISKDFPPLPMIETINITFTKLAYTRPSLFEKLTELKELDLRLNELDHMEGPLLIHNHFEAMYLSGELSGEVQVRIVSSPVSPSLLPGNKWNCTRNMKWLLKFEGQKVADKDVMKCVDLKYTGRPLLTVMDFKQTIRSECQKEPDIRNCSCILSYVRPSMNGEFLIPMYTVNCSNREFYSLPPVLPRNTTILHITHNKIRNLEPLRTNQNYTKVQDMYLDFNQIKTIDMLEGAPWLHRFRVLSLRGNKLTKLTYHMIDNALEKNSFAVEIYLSNNPWRCDCSFTPVFHDLILKYKTLVKDAFNITCKYLEGDKNFGLSVIKLNRGDVCVTNRSSDEFLKPIDVLNIVLASLIVFIFAKLAYDYYHYKKYSQLPWFVTKLP